MSFEEKSTWVMAVIGLAAFTGYLWVIVDRLQDASIGEVAYEATLLGAVAIAIGASIVAHIAIAIASPKDAGQSDERDARFNRQGYYVGGFVLAFGALLAMSLSLAKLEHFWIANTIYAAFVLMEVTACAVKLVGYRRGF